uniref:NOP2/Sun RNA methyltransferase 3 n=1 Tax=Gasterosteus aculeatus aculeatus TaxID=481459 RepID=A0AAQ4PND5_GASAC
MFLTPRTSSTWRLAPSPRWWPVNCHSGHALVSQPNGAARDQETKRKARPSCQAVLDRFDEQYSQELGDLWESARAVLLDPGSWQYGVMLNRFSIVTGISQILQSQGFSTLLPQTRGPAVLPSGPAAVSRSKCRAGKGSLLPPGHISKWPPNDSYLQPDIKSPARDQDLESEPSPVLALKVQDGEKVLDLCSAPGGKAVAILQCATPALLCCNEPDPQRRDWLAKTLESFLSQSLTSRVIVSAQDGRSFGQSEAGTYDKVLVDSPCSNDRSWLYCGGQQGEQRLKERAGLPALQAQLLRSALSAVRPGGVVVYSTCTLSSFENFAVVETVLNDCPEAEPEDLWEEIGIPLSEHFTFRTTHPGGSQTPHNASLQPHNAPSSSYRHRLGLLVVPQPGKTWGPMFLSRIRRRK